MHIPSRHLLLAVPLCLVGSASLALAAPQGSGVSELGRLTYNEDLNDIWGYTAPDGREYALVGTISGLSVVNCSDPANPYQTGFINGPVSLWRDVKAYDHYAYTVTEGAGGMQIVDLADPEHPSLVKTWGAGLWSDAHNIEIDPDAGVAYVCGTNNGMLLMDLTDPVNPVHIASYTANYVHDLHAQHGRAHLAEIYAGVYRIVRTDQLPAFPTTDSIVTPGAFTHNTWASIDDRLAVTTDEIPGGRVGVYDISNENNIVLLDSFTVDSRTIPHNAFIRGDRAYVSWYTEGLVVLDLSNPSQVQELGSYDTSSYGPTAGFHGAWGCYPFAPSGVIYISDIESGLHLLQVNGNTDTIALTGPTSGPAGATLSYQVHWAPINQRYWAVWSPNLGGTLHAGHQFDLGSPTTVLLSGTTDARGAAAFSGTLPPGTSGMTIQLEIAAVDASGAFHDSNPLTLTVQ